MDRCNTNMNQLKQTFNVHGMSCTGCELVIENALTGVDGISEVQADYSKNTVTVIYDSSRIDFGKIKAILKKEGYSLEMPQSENEGKPDKKKVKTFSVIQFIGIVVIVLALYLIISNTAGFNFIPNITSNMSYGVLFIVGLLTSLHCVAMCGGINMSQCVNSGTDGMKGKFKPSLLYNLGRVTSYTIIGGIIGALGSVISFSGWARGLVAILSGVFMVLMGISMTGIFPWVNKIIPRLPRIFRAQAGSAGRGKGPFIVGLLNGLMPCGPLQAMQIYALGTGSLISGALSMFFFSLGTLPLMFGLGAVITMLGSKFTKKMMRVSAVMVAVLGVIMLGRGLVLSGISVPSITPPASTSSSKSAATATVESGIQNITSTLTTRGYPSITVQKDVPVVWNLKADSRSLNGCNSTLIIPEFNMKVQLKEGDNIIKFTPTESKTIPYSCWMGMVTGQISVVDELNGKSAQAASDESTADSSSLPTFGMSCCQGPAQQ